MVIDEQKELCSSNAKIIEKTNAEIIKNLYGICIIFLKFYVDDKFRPDLSYHLHFTISSEEDSYTAICLDTGSIFTDTQENFENILLTLIEDFIDCLFYSIDRKFENSDIYLFKHTKDNKIWDVFNKVKTNAFYQSMKMELDYNESILEDGNNFKYEYKKNKLSIIGEVIEERKVAV